MDELFFDWRIELTGSVSGIRVSTIRLEHMTEETARWLLKNCEARWPILVASLFKEIRLEKQT